MKLVEMILWMLVLLVITAIGVNKINEHIETLRDFPPATRYEVINGQRVPFWVSQHRGEPIRIYRCPGQEPKVAIAQEPIRCEQTS